MKRSSFQIIAIVSLLALGTLTVTPFLPKADANCDYYTEEYCDSAKAYYVYKAALAIVICYENPGSDACEAAKQSAANAKQWADWVCEHADS